MYMYSARDIVDKHSATLIQNIVTIIIIIVMIVI